MVGGSAAAYQAAMGLGLVPVSEQIELPELAPLGKDGHRKVVILGAGISGLTAAYELSRKGYDVQVLEASRRVGGRNLTLRAGDRVEESGNSQLCRFDADPDLYFNAGPARIPGHHTALLGYCRKFNVALTPFINDNRNAWVQDPAAFKGVRVRNREYMAATRGFISELLAKSFKPEEFGATFTKADYQQLLEYLREFGDLDAKLRYQGSLRAGAKTHDLTRGDEVKTPLELRELLRSRLFFALGFGEGQDQSATMLEPVGGMDRIVAAFEQRVRNLVRTEAQVTSIQLKDRGVDVIYEQQGKSTKVSADYCLNCTPVHLLSRIAHNFPADYAAGCAAIKPGKLFKIGLQMKQRFWEDEGIYGGISWTLQDITQIWYPVHGIHGRKGIVLGAYTFDEALGEKFGRLSPAQRIELAIQQGEKVHPGYRKYVENGVSIPWHRMTNIMGCSARWSDELRARWMKRLQAPVGRHYLIGDQVSYHPGWQEGAIHSAYHAMADIDRRVRAEGTNVAAA